MNEQYEKPSLLEQTKDKLFGLGWFGVLGAIFVLIALTQLYGVLFGSNVVVHSSGVDLVPDEKIRYYQSKPGKIPSWIKPFPLTDEEKKASDSGYSTETQVLPPLPEGSVWKKATEGDNNS